MSESGIDDVDEAADTISDYKALIVRAMEIIKGAPYWAYVYEERYVRLDIHDDNSASLKWPRVTTEWDAAVIEHESCYFPASLLFLTDDDLKAWKEEQKAIYDKEQDAKQRATIEASEKRERLVLAALQAKYGALR